MTEDSELLKRFQENACTEAFSEIVARHIDLVYSVAYRQVGSMTHLASDVCQDTFVTLARKATRIKPGTVLAGWLYSTARFSARTAVRTEIRRRKREQEAYEMNHNPNEISMSDEEWENARPLLDEAISELNTKDRDAIFLRFFENRTFSEIGRHLDLKENAARMRVSRSLDKLNALMAKRGIRSTSTALTAALVGQITTAAPASLAAGITQTAFSSVSTVSSISTLGTILNTMKSSKIALVCVSIASATSIGSAVYLAATVEKARTTLESLDNVDPSSENKKALQGLLAQRKRELDSLKQVLDSAQSNSTPTHGFTAEDFENELIAWVTRVDHLTRFLSQNEHLRIPEIELLTPEEWMEVVKNDPLKTELDYRKTLGKLRAVAKRKTYPKVRSALSKYMSKFKGTLPNSVTELADYLDKDISPETLARYRINHGEIPPDEWKTRHGLRTKEVILYEVPIDDLWDTTTLLAKDRSLRTQRGKDGAYSIAKSIEAFIAQEQRSPKNAAELTPYLEDQFDPNVVSEVLISHATPIEFDSFGQ